MPTPVSWCLYVVLLGCWRWYAKNGILERFLQGGLIEARCWQFQQKLQRWFCDIVKFIDLVN